MAMTDAKTILTMIEAVAPDDTLMLDEIDARAFCHVHDLELRYEGHRRSSGSRGGHIVVNFWFPDGRHGQEEIWNPYTRSRDALKAIRSEGWLTRLEPRFFCEPTGKTMFRAYSIKPLGETHMECFDNLVSPLLPAEELAELHAIIQAIEHERTHHDRDK